MRRTGKALYTLYSVIGKTARSAYWSNYCSRKRGKNLDPSQLENYKKNCKDVMFHKYKEPTLAYPTILWNDTAPAATAQAATAPALTAAEMVKQQEEAVKLFQPLNAMVDQIETAIKAETNLSTAPNIKNQLPDLLEVLKDKNKTERELRNKKIFTEIQGKIKEKQKTKDVSQEKAEMQKYMARITTLLVSQYAEMAPFIQGLNENPSAPNDAVLQQLSFVFKSAPEILELISDYRCFLRFQTMEVQTYDALNFDDFKILKVMKNYEDNLIETSRNQENMTQFMAIMKTYPTDEVLSKHLHLIQGEDIERIDNYRNYLYQLKGQAQPQSIQVLIDASSSKPPEDEEEDDDDEDEEEAARIAAAALKADEEAKIVALSTELRNCYLVDDRGHDARPPEWSLGHKIVQSFDGGYEYVGDEKWTDLAKKVTVYHIENTADVKLLVARREPVNLFGRGPDTHYDSANYTSFLEKIEKTNIPTTYKNENNSMSAYSYMWDNGDKEHLPPNFAMYIETPISNEFNNEQHKQNIKVLNCIGYAFDDKCQPDYKYFIDSQTNDFKEGKKEMYERKIYDIFQFIFTCVHQKNIKTLAMSYIGGAAFSGLYPGNEPEYRIVFLKKFGEFIQNNPDIDKGLEIVIVGCERDYTMREFAKEFTKKCRELGFANVVCPGPQHRDVPALCFYLQDKNEHTLYVNAWDPHSIVGNGNENDRSLDGFFGRTTAMAFLSLPCFNPHIQYFNLGA